MIKRNELDSWYANKYPEFELSSNSVINNMQYKSSINKSIGKNWLNYCTYYGNTNGENNIVNILCKKYNCHPQNILITNGASEALYILLQIFLQNKTKIMVQKPYYQNLEEIIKNNGSKLIKIELDEKNSWNFSSEEFIYRFESDTSLALLNFPNNPTGKSLLDFEYEKIVKFAKNNNLHILFDEVSANISSEYKKSWVEKNIRSNLDNVICINSMSKAYGYSGLRIGWIVASDDIIQKAQVIKEIISVSCSPLTQQIAYELLMQEERIILSNIRVVNENTKYLFDIISKYSNIVSCNKPDGGASCFMKLLFNTNSYEFCKKLYREEKVLLVPGTIFGFENYVRIGLGNSTINFKMGIKKLFNFIENYY